MNGLISREKISKLSKAYNNNHDIYNMLMDKDFCRWNNNEELVILLLEERCCTLNLLIDIDKAINTGEKTELFYDAVNYLEDIDSDNLDKVKEVRDKYQKTADDLKQFIDFIKEY